MKDADQTDLRLDYRLREDAGLPHYFVCDIPKGLPDPVVKAVLVAMRRVNLLENLRKGRDYVWEGATQIAFRRDEDAALYKLFVVLPSSIGTSR